jgi:23S rRNA (cytosine1962-C5)-methyltransferase
LTFSIRFRSRPPTPNLRSLPETPLKTVAQNSQVLVTQRGAARIRDGHPWVYRSDVKPGRDVAPGSVVDVIDNRGKAIASAIYSSSSQIALRVIARGPVTDLVDLIRHRIADAVAYRRRVVCNSDSYRVVFSEADQIPGLIADKYNDVVTFQLLAQAMDSDAVRAAVVESLTAQLAPDTIIERSDPRIRELEQLPARETQVVYSAEKNSPKTATVISMNGLSFNFDALTGQKTGAFLDQRENYAAAERYARGRALDICTYQGGFALHLNRGCDQVTGVDISRTALEVADQNAALNGQKEIDWIEANAFDLMKEYSTNGEQYDTIVLDPPAFAKSKAQMEGAIRGYKEMNLRALKMLKPGGTLVTCSCSQAVTEEDFIAMLGSAALDAHRTVRILEKRTQSQDHPIVLNIPETYYLKCIIASV